MKSPIWRPYTQERIAKAPVSLASAGGAYLISRSGRKYFDGISSWWLITHGHCQPEISEAIRKQAGQLDQVVFANFTHEPGEELAELLIDSTPPPLKHVFFSDNGSTAVEVAMKMAYQACAIEYGEKSRTKFMTFKSAYHGDTVGAMSLSGRSQFSNPFKFLLFEVISVEHPLNGSAEHFVAPFRAAFEENKERIAAVIIEPLVQGAGGMVIWPDEAVKEIADLCLRAGVYLIFDEVMTGFGRTGSLFAMNRLGVSPDFVCLSKGLTGGSLPLSATLTTDHVYDCFLSGDSREMFFHGHSFTGNPISCAAAVANVQLFRNGTWKKAAKQIEIAHQKSLLRVSNKLTIRNPRVCGTIGAFTLPTEDQSYGHPLSSRVAEAALEDGVFVRTLGAEIYLMPPYCASGQEVEDAWTTLTDVIAKLI